MSSKDNNGKYMGSVESDLKADCIPKVGKCLIFLLRYPPFSRC